MKLLLFHLPLIAFLAIQLFVALVETGHLPALRTESTYGWIVAVWYPLSALLALTQLTLWIFWIAKRVSRFRRSGG